MVLVDKPRAIGAEIGIDGKRITIARPSTIGAVDVQTAPTQAPPPTRRPSS